MVDILCRELSFLDFLYDAYLFMYVANFIEDYMRGVSVK